MSIDATFPSAQEEFDKFMEAKSQKAQGLTPAPMTFEFPDAINNSFGESDFQPFEKPFNFSRPKEKEVPGFFETAAHEFKDIEVVAHGLSYAYDKYNQIAPSISNDLEHQNPLTETTPDGWTAYKKENFMDYEERFWPYIANSESPAEMQLRQQEAAKIQKEDEYYRDGSIWAKIAGGAAGVAVDIPVFAFIPMAASLKYAKTSANIVQNMIRQAPGITASTIAYTAAIDSTTTGKTMSDFAWDSAVNSIAGIALAGGAAGLGRALTGGEIYNAKHFLKMNIEGIEAKNIVDSRGVITGKKAVLSPNSAASAMEVTRAQEFLDSQFSKIGLFKVPFLGTAIEKVAAPFSPILRGLNSEWATTAAYTNRIADHSIETVGITEGRAAPAKFESLMNEYHSAGIQMGQRIEGYRNTANGVGGEGVVNAGKRLIHRVNSGQSYSKDDWGRMVMTHLFTGEASDVSEVNQLGTELKEYYKNILNLYQKAHGLEEKDLPVKTAASYLSRRYDVDSMLTNQNAWVDMTKKWFRDGDRLISEVEQPLNDASMRVAQLKQDIRNGIDLDENRNLLREARRIERRERDALKERIREDEDLHIHLDERLTMSKLEEKALKLKLQPWKEAKKLHSKKKEQISSTKRKISDLNSKFASGAKKGQTKDYPKIKTEIQALEKQLAYFESEAAKLEKTVYDTHQSLLDEVAEGSINRNMYSKNEETGKITFKNPNARPKFRKLYSSHGEFAEAEMEKDALAYFNSITGTNPDKLAQEMLNGFHGSITGSPLKERSLMIPDQILLDNNFLSTDISRNAALYAITLGKKTSYRTALNGFGVSKDGIHGVVEELTKELAKKKAALSSLPEDKQAKAILKLQRSFNKEKQFISTMHEVAQGNYARFKGGETTRDWVRFTRGMTASTRLGNVPIAQLPDIAGNIIKQGPWKFFRDGLLPSITTMNGRIKSAKGMNYRQSASTAGLCLETTLNSHADSLWNYTTQSTTTIPGKLANGANTLAKLAGNASGANTVENFNQALAANISQSNLIDAMFKYKAGTLSAREARKLAQFGVDPEVWSSRIIKSFENSDGFAKKTGGYISDYSNWEDKEARNLMASTIRKSVGETIIKRGLLDSPLISNDPVTSLIFTFTGWFFAAFNRYTIPMLQRPFDSYLVTGSVASLGLSALVDPLRAWSRGEEFKLDDDNWFYHAMSNIQPFAPIYNAALKVNAVTGADYMNKLKNDRHRQIEIAAALGGPSVGLAQVYYNAIRMFASGKINQKDFKNMLNAVPMAQMWYMNDWKNQFMDSLFQGLPSNYQNAPGYGE